MDGQKKYSTEHSPQVLLPSVEGVRACRLSGMVIPTLILGKKFSMQTGTGTVARPQAVDYRNGNGIDADGIAIALSYNRRSGAQERATGNELRPEVLIRRPSCISGIKVLSRVHAKQAHQTQNPNLKKSALLAVRFARDASGRKNFIQHQIHDDSCDGDVKPDWIRPSRNGAVLRKSGSQRESQRDEDQGHERGRQNRVA